MPEIFGIAVARQKLAASLKSHLPRYDIFPNPRTLNTITKPTLVIERTRVEKAAIGVHLNTFTLYLIEPKTDGVAAEDSLDILLEDVLAALDLSGVKWSSASRETWSADSNPSYAITLNTNSTRKQST